MSDKFRKWLGGGDQNLGTGGSKGELIKVAIAAAPPVIERAIAIWRWASETPSILASLPRISNACVLFLILLFVATNRPQTDEQEFPKASREVRTFSHLWLSFWLVFFLIYIFRIARGLALPGLDLAQAGTHDVIAAVWWNLLDNALSNVTLLMLFLCYVVLAGYAIAGYVIGGIVAFIVLSAAEAVGIQLLHSEPGMLLWTLLIWQILLGTLACTIFALLIGRLESKIIGPPLWIIFALYFYAGLQPLAQALSFISPIVSNQPALQLFIGEAAAWLGFFAALLKVLLFGLVYWMLDSGVLLFYMNWLTKTGP